MAHAAPRADTHVSVGDRAHWRASVDRAWRSSKTRELFERESGLKSTDLPERQMGTSEYERSFLVWATRHLQLEEIAPSEVRTKLR